MGGVREIRRCVGRARLRRRARPPLALGAAARRPALLPGLRGLRGAGRALRHAGRAHGPAAAVRAGAADPVPRQRAARLPRARARRRARRGALGRRGGVAGRQARRTCTSTRRRTRSRASRPRSRRGCAGAAGRGSCSGRTGPCWPPRGAWRASTAWAWTTRRDGSSSAATPGGSSRSERGSAGRSRDRSGQQDHQDDDEDERADADVHLEDLLSSGTAPSYPGGARRTRQWGATTPPSGAMGRSSAAQRSIPPAIELAR